jgi:eukaryotic-like serine/threonine-protein kinase
MSEDLKPGDFVTKTVQLVRPIGQGGMGTVWLADHLQLDTRVVVKVMAHGLEHRADILARFAREAMICAQVKSPHVVQVFDTGTTDDGHPFIVMEFLEGHDLGKQLHEHGPMMPTAFAPIVVQLAKALARAHRAGIVHRDLKPENVMISTLAGGGERAVVMDFGLAKERRLDAELQKLTATGIILGTPEFMSPEQLRGRPLDPRTDVYSLALMTYEMLTGKLPFTGRTQQEMMIARLKSDPIPLREAAPSLGLEAVERVLAKAMQRDPGDRYQSAPELATALATAAKLDGDENARLTRFFAR